MKNVRSRGWCFTVNNYDEDDICYVSSLYEDDVNCKYLIVGFETADRTGTPHLQCYIYYTDAISWQSMKQNMENNINAKCYHFEVAKSMVAAYCYCMEEGDYYEYGLRPRQGHRTDLEVIKYDMLHKKKTLKEVSSEYFSQYCQYFRPFESFRRLHDLDKFETKLIMYDNESIHKIYRDYPVGESLIVVSVYDYPPNVVLHMYHSRRYRYIFYPNSEYVPEQVQDLVDETLY